MNKGQKGQWDDSRDEACKINSCENVECSGIMNSKCLYILCTKVCADPFLNFSLLFGVFVQKNRTPTSPQLLFIILTDMVCGSQY